MAPETARPDPEEGLLRWSNAALEASVLYVVLAAWTRPRDGAAILLPLAACLALPGGLLARRALEWTAAQPIPRQVAAVLCATAWAVTAARLIAPPGFWQADAPRALLLISAIFGEPIRAGYQPLVFWASLLLWWRGHLLLDWLPGLDDALNRLRLGGLVVSAAVLLVALGDDAEQRRLAQVEQIAAVAAFLAAAVVSTAISRRREMAGGAMAAPTLPEAGRDSRSARPIAGLVAVFVGLAALAAAAWGADVVTPGLLAPGVSFVGEVLGALGAGLARIAQAIGSLWPTPPPTQPAATGPRPTPVIGEPFRLPRLDLPPWLGPFLAVVTLVAGLALVGRLFALAVRALLDTTYAAPNPVSGLEDEQPRPVEERGPIAVLARLLRLFRGTVRRGRARGRDAAPPASNPATEPAVASVRDAYRELLRWADSRGCRRRADETPDELRRRLVAACPPRGPEITVLTSLYVAVRYGREPLRTPDLERARRAVVSLRAPRPEDDAGPRDGGAVARPS